MKRRYHLHLPGTFYLLLTVFVGLSAAFSRYNNLLVWVFGVMLGAILISGLISGYMLMRVRIMRLDPGHGNVAEPLVIRYAITNRSRWFPLFDLHIEELPSSSPTSWSLLMKGGNGWILHAGGGETVHAEAVYWPTARGRPEFTRFRVWSTFPFGLIKKSVTVSQVNHTLIYPRVYALRPRLIESVAPVGISGVRLSRQSGLGDEFFGTREYRPGDSVRQIAWKRAAGLDTLVTIERARASPPRLRVVLNLSKPTSQLRVDSGQSQDGLEEDAISLAASLLSEASSHGYETGLSILGYDIPSTPLRRSHWHLQKMLGALASIDRAAPRRAVVPVGEVERCAVVAVHPDAAAPSLAPPEAVHLVATQLSRFVEPESASVRPKVVETVA